ncbi:MAG TPA: DUF2157 domain-containing protein [Thermoanaerobaculia bacterium]
MLNLEPELVQLRDAGRITAVAAAPLIAQERRDTISVYAEVRMMAWVGVMLIVTGAGIILSHNLDRIGPVAIAVVVGAASLACYAYCVWRRATVHSEFVLLLGALLLSADLGYIEHQFHLLGNEWTAHFLVLAFIHCVTAYYFDSAAVLSLSIAALASWFGIERNIDTFFTDSFATSMRAFACAAVVGAWRFANPRPQFERVFDHFIANLALWGGLILTFHDDTRPVGVLLVIVMAVLVIAYGFRKRQEAFVIYAYVYAVIAVTTLFIGDLFIHDATMTFFFITLVMIAAIVGLFFLHARFRAVTE